jgi:hypothetical protein
MVVVKAVDANVMTALDVVEINRKPGSPTKYHPFGMARILLFVTSYRRRKFHGNKCVRGVVRLRSEPLCAGDYGKQLCANPSPDNVFR